MSLKCPLIDLFLGLFCSSFDGIMYPVKKGFNSVIATRGNLAGSSLDGIVYPVEEGFNSVIATWEDLAGRCRGEVGDSG